MTTLLQALRRRYIQATAKEHSKVQRYEHFLIWYYILEDGFDFDWYCRFHDVAKEIGVTTFHLPDKGFIDGSYHYTIGIHGTSKQLDEFISLMWYDVDIRGIC